MICIIVIVCILLNQYFKRRYDTVARWIIRAVDWGNIQRSPTFEAIFNYFYSDSNSLLVPVIFDSAGTRVNQIMQNLTPIFKQLDIMDASLTLDIVKGENKHLAKKLISKWYGKEEKEIPKKNKMEITHLYSKIKENVHLHQMQYRNEALLDVGIPEQYLPGMRVPFKHNVKLKLIIPVEENIAQDIEDFYKPLENNQPLTEIYGDLVGIKPLKDELDGGIKIAKKQVEYFMKTRAEAIERINSLIAKIVI
jgi:hypothetical protein